MIELNKH